jgi:outer membrane protein OmpA-like peptidoglycan-associated protein
VIGNALLRTAASLALSAALGGCATVPIHVASLDQLEQIRGTPAAKELARRVPEYVALAERERALALQAHAAGDDVEASLRAECAIAAYERAVAVARWATAESEMTDASGALGVTRDAQEALDATRADLERKADELARRAQVARERTLPAPSGDAPERDAARRTAARSMAAEARLLCAAARLIAPGADGVAASDTELATLARKIDAGPSGDAIDGATRARAHCLDVLTRARRASASHDQRDDAGTDVLLSELSDAKGWSPSRDERGIVVTLREAYRGSDLTDEATGKLRDLGRVASAHPAFGVQVVVHDAATAKDSEDAKRAQAAVAALVAGGATAARVDSQLAGARIPIADPADPRSRARNDRLDIVFVGP